MQPQLLARPVRVVLADSRPLMVEAIARRLEQDPRLVVARIATDGDTLLSCVREDRPDVTVCGLLTPLLSGEDATRSIVALDPSARVVLLMTAEDDSVVVGALQAGAVACLSSTTTADELVETIHDVAHGHYRPANDVFTSVLLELRRTAQPQGSASEVASNSPSFLSSRERSVLALVSRGLSNRDIGASLYLSEQTVKTYLERAYRKLGVSNRASAVRTALERGFLE